MRRGRLLILIALLLVFSAVGIFIAFSLGGGLIASQPPPMPGEVQQLDTPPPQETEEPVLYIVAAGQNLERGAVIPTQAVVMIPWPTSIVPPSAVTDPEQVVGTRARYTLMRGEPIFSTMYVESLQQLSPTGSDAAAQIPPGLVAISMPYNRQNGVAYGVKPGDYVNIYVSWAIIDIDQNFQSALPNLSTVLSPPNPDAVLPILPSDVSVVNSGMDSANPVGRGEGGVGVGAEFYVIPSEAQRPRLVSQSIIQDVMVLQMGEFSDDKPEVIEATPTPDPAIEVTEAAPPTATPAPPDIMTVVVTPQDALVLNYINRLAERYPGSVTVTVVLRSAGDHSRVATESVTLQYMFERFEIALPAKLTYGLDASPPPAAAFQEP
jgi:Flp pilus assembly protein CpaB